MSPKLKITKKKGVQKNQNKSKKTLENYKINKQVKIIKIKIKRKKIKVSKTQNILKIIHKT